MFFELPPTIPCTFHINNKIYQCAWGQNGVNVSKREGDNTTPQGKFKLREIYYRFDRIPDYTIKTNLPTHPIKRIDAWCDDPNLHEYNSYITLPHTGSYERLWREDALYDIVIVIGYNDRPTLRHKGSAIFLHVAANNYKPTKGCIALAKKDLIELLPYFSKDTILEVKPQGVFISTTGQIHP